MARSSTTFSKGTAPKGKGGAKHARTKVKEAIGVKAWEDLINWADGAGIEKCIAEISKLKGKDYVYAYSTVIEYIKPKLARTTVAGDKDNPIHTEVRHTVVFKKYGQGDKS